MTPAEKQYLSDAFARAANRVVEGNELQEKMLALMESALTKSEIIEYMNNKPNANLSKEPALVRQIESETPDGSLGVYADEAERTGVYIHTSFLKHGMLVALAESPISYNVQKKAVDCTVAALEQCKDYSGEVGKKLQPMPLF